MERGEGTIRISTSRLILRDMVPEDCEMLYKMDSDPRVNASLFGVAPPSSPEESLGYITKIRTQYKENGVGRLAVVEKSSEQFIGWAGLKIEKNINGHESFYDLGYRFIPEYWNKGYATEASRALVAFGFEVLGVDKICAYAESDNLGSIRVAEKAGLKLVSKFPGERIEEHWMEIKKLDYDGSMMEDIKFFTH